MNTRKVKEAKDLASNELIYFKGHAKATYMSNGKTVEDAIENTNASIAELNDNIEKLSLDVSPLFVYGGTMNLAFTDFVNFCKINLYAGNAPVKYIPDENNADHFILERSIVTYYGSGITAKRECASVYRTGSSSIKTSEIRTNTYELP